MEAAGHASFHEGSLTDVSWVTPKSNVPPLPQMSNRPVVQSVGHVHAGVIATIGGVEMFRREARLVAFIQPSLEG